jgi:NADH-quinone oxidoreductase subunit N
MWAPDVYHGAPSAVTILISSAPKLAAAGMMFRIFAFGLPAIAAQWQPLFTMVALLSVIVGNLFAVVQTNIKRLFAYSAIAHMGYMLFGLIAATPEGFAASLYYILIYGLMAVAGFGLIIMMSRLGLDAEMIDDLKGLNARSPWLAAMMLITLFSMVGVPPMVGFFTKFMVLKALVASGFMKLAFIGLVAAVIGAYNYIRIVKTMYFETPVLSSSLVITTSVKAVFSVNALCLLAFGLAPNAIVQACIQAFNASN